MPEPSERRPRSLSVAVLCTACQSTPATARVAHELGELLGCHAHRLIYGGSGAGLMGELARAAHQNGSQIFGAIPDFLFERERDTDGPSQVLRITKTVCQRKDLMFNMADVFIALPGGIDTVDEVLDVISLSCHGFHRKPLLLLQTCGEWEPLLDLIVRLVPGGLERLRDNTLLHVVSSAAEALEIVNGCLRVAG